MPIPLRLAVWPLLLVGACGREVSRDELAARRAERPARPVPVQYDTAVYVAQQAGAPAPAISAVMELRATARDAQVTIENATGQQALAGAPGGEQLQEMVGSHAVTTSDSGSTGWHASVSVPVLEGERYLVELYPSSRREDSTTFVLSADATRLMTAFVVYDATDGTPPLFEIAVGARTISVGPQIGPFEIVPSCTTTHVVRNAGRAALDAQYEVPETGERGDVTLPARDEHALFRGTTVHTKTRGGLRVTYLDRELASVAMPSGCPRT